MIEKRMRLAVPSEQEGARLDAFLVARVGELSRSAWRRLILEGRVVVDTRPASKPGLALKEGMCVEVTLPDPAPDSPEPEEIPVGILYEDDFLLVVDKAAGLVVHPGHGRPGGTLVNALLGRGASLAPAGGVHRPGIVHRLDADTSGVLVVAKDNETLRALQRSFAERRVQKSYLALVWGRPRPPEGRIERPIGRSRANPTRMAIRGTRAAREAITLYRTVEELPGLTLLSVRIETGRTHQIRVHLQSIHHPVVGDARYGGRQEKGVQDPRKRKALRSFQRLGLHASELAFLHPRTLSEVRFRSPLPPEFEGLLSVLRSSG